MLKSETMHVLDALEPKDMFCDANHLSLYMTFVLKWSVTTLNCEIWYICKKKKAIKYASISLTNNMKIQVKKYNIRIVGVFPIASPPLPSWKK